MNPPEPNGDPIKVGEFTVELQVCPDTCCDPVIKSGKKKGQPNPKERYFVRDKSGGLVGMARDWDDLCRARGWT